jgi:hypothetical protein
VILQNAKLVFKAVSGYWCAARNQFRKGKVICTPTFDDVNDKRQKTKDKRQKTIIVSTLFEREKYSPASTK